MDLSKSYLHTLGERESKLLADLRGRIPDIVAKARAEASDTTALERPTIWGVDLQAAGSDMVLLKYLRAEELDLEKAVARLVATLVFRADCQIDALARAELPEHFRGHDTIEGLDVDGRPVMVSRFGGMDLPKVFGDVEAFVRYRAQLMERAVAKLSFKRGAVEDLCQVHDYSGVPLFFQTSEVKGSVAAVSKVFGEHYPELKGKTIFVNFPAAFSKLFKAFSLFIPQRTLDKFLILGENDQAALFEHIAPEVVPEGIGGMLRASGLHGPCKVVTVRARSVEEVSALEVTAASAKVRWELRVCYSEVGYEVVFVAADSSQEEIIAKTEPRQYLQAADGIASGEWTAKGPGIVKCRFRNECAWFKSRLCMCRAELGQ